MVNWHFNAIDTELPKDKPVTELTITGTINEKIAKELAKLIEENKTITKLSINATFIPLMGNEYRAFQVSRVGAKEGKELAIAEKEDVFRPIAHALMKNQTITEINMGDDLLNVPIYHSKNFETNREWAALLDDMDVQHPEPVLQVVPRKDVGECYSHLTGNTLVFYNVSFEPGSDKKEVGEYTAVEDRNLRRNTGVMTNLLPNMTQKTTQSLSREGSFWFDPKYVYGIGYAAMAIAGLSAIIMVILNAEWEANPYSIPGATGAILTIAAAVYGIGAAVHYATSDPKEHPSKFLANTFYLLGSALFFGTSAYLLAENGLISQSIQLPDNGTEKVFALLYGAMGLGSLVATAGHVGNVFNPKA